MTARRRFGSLRKTKAGRWQARYKGPDGRPRTAPTTFATKTDASLYLAGVETDLYRGTWYDPTAGNVLLARYSEDWLKHRKLAPRTRDLYAEILRIHIRPQLGDMPLSSISAAEVRRWLNDAGKRTGQRRVSASYTLLRTILNTAVSDGLLPSNPCRVKGAGQSVAPERPLLSVEQVYALADAIEPYLKPVVLIIFWAHLRRGELLALRRGDVDLAAGTLCIDFQVIRTSTGYQTTAPKAASRRTIDLSAPAVEILRQHLAATGPALPSALLFTRPDGGVLRQQHIQVAWQKAREEVDLPGLHVHDLRHASLTLAAQTGASTKEIMARGGHSSLRAAMIYQHYAAERGRVIADSMTVTADAAAPDRGIATP
ncbi:MAG: hypothetical protein QOI54_3325 [Actinomycetota bacterium]|jgi:integrase|nr:hypothetical protein [Actinomycetota bacterium]